MIYGIIRIYMIFRIILYIRLNPEILSNACFNSGRDGRHNNFRHHETGSLPSYPLHHLLESFILEFAITIKPRDLPLSRVEIFQLSIPRIGCVNDIISEKRTHKRREHQPDHVAHDSYDRQHHYQYKKYFHDGVPLNIILRTDR